MSDIIVGIDLGTTNSEVAIIENGRPTVLADKDGLQIIPSVVGVSPKGEMIVGTEARNQYIIAPERTIRSIKRKMGTAENVLMDGKGYTPQEISAFILRKLKEIAERKLGDVKKAVITVPAYFSDVQRQATKDAGEIAGFEVMRIINEPTAAALAYGIDKEENQFLLVYDLGGGTFDVSVIEMNSGIVEVRASHGNTHLGGDDFDERIVNYVVSEFQIEHGIDLRENPQAVARINRAAEIAKIQLSDRPYARIREEFIITKGNKSLSIDMEISRNQFESMIKDLVIPTLDAMKIALNESNLTARDIDKVLMVGGATRIPLVMEMVADWCGKQPRSEMNPELCVAMGAAVQAGIISGESIETILVDVVPHSLGVAVTMYIGVTRVHDRFSTIIHRNSAIPTSKSEVYTTGYDRQNAVEIEVYQGENPTASENILLGKFKLDIPPAPAGEPQIIVTFDYDVNGIVHVSAMDKNTKKEKKITVTASPERLTDEEISKAKERADLEWGQSPTDKDLEALISEASRMVSELKHKGKNTKKLAQVLQQLQAAINNNEDDEKIFELEDKIVYEMYALEDKE
ncbi:MAG: Hsp70 family protein [Candidatus Poribacteria bacterium]